MHKNFRIFLKRPLAQTHLPLLIVRLTTMKPSACLPKNLKTSSAQFDMAIQSTNPTTREVIKTFEEEGRESVERKMSMAHEAFLKSKDVPIAQRAAFVKRMAEVLRVGKEEYARLMALEMGKPIAQARSEVEKCAWACEVAGEYGPKWLEEEVIIPSPDLRSPSPQGRWEGEGRPGDPQKAYIRFEPLGVILPMCRSVRWQLRKYFTKLGQGMVWCRWC